jgi:pimeloyl-ACP methyl ester carboxylesterase
MTTLESNFIQANGLRLHYLRKPAPNKPTLLLLHGLTDAGICWTPIIEELSGDYEIVAPDARGHGMSDTPETGYSAEDHAADAAAFIQALELNKPIVMGHSMGGMQATVLAAKHPALVRAALFEDPAWFDASQQPSLEMRQQRRAEWLADMMATKALAPDAMVAKRRAADPLWSDAEFRAWCVAKQQVHPVVLEYIEHPPTDWRACVTALQCPSLLITGDVSRGVIISPEQAAAAQALNSNLHIAHVPGAGHSIRRDNFMGYVQAVRDFLSQVNA